MNRIQDKTVLAFTLFARAAIVSSEAGIFAALHPMSLQRSLYNGFEPLILIRFCAVAPKPTIPQRTHCFSSAAANQSHSERFAINRFCVLQP